MEKQITLNKEEVVTLITLIEQELKECYSYPDFISDDLKKYNNERIVKLEALTKKLFYSQIN